MEINITKHSTLFLDRDGVINEKAEEEDYVKNWGEFHFSERAKEALSILRKRFERIIIVTNQRGVGKGLMTESDLLLIHKKMSEEIGEGLIDKIYYSTDLSDDSINRKPNVGMALKAKQDFPRINFKKSFMVGDSITDMYFGANLGMRRVWINSNVNSTIDPSCYDFTFKSLYCFSKFITESHK